MADGEVPSTSSPPKVAKVARRIKFRLDDGSLIADSCLVGAEDAAGVVRVPMEQLAQRNLVGEKEIQRLQRLLSAPDLPEANGTEMGPPPKKQRVEPKPAIVAPGPAQPENWIPKGKDVLQKLRHFLGKDTFWFENAVDRNVVADYYTLITHPMWFGKVQQKLEAGEYATPSDFADDLRLIWKNCFTYNRKGEGAEPAGRRGESKFEELWAKTGLSNERSRRATAGVAAPKFEPELEAAKPNVLRSGPSRSGAPMAAPAANTKRAPSASGARGNGVRAYSHEVTSGGKAREKALSSERRAQIANDLQTALGDGSLAEDQLNELLALLPPEAMSADESGEMELDFESLDDGGLRKLDTWLRNIKGQGAPSPSHVSYNPSVRLEANNYDDDDYVSD